MLNGVDRTGITPIIQQVLNTTKFYNEVFPGFTIYITGSSLNLIDRSYNDIDLMVIIPEQQISVSKSELLKHIGDLIRNNDSNNIEQMKNNNKVKLLGLMDLLGSIIDSISYRKAILQGNSQELLRRLGSNNEVIKVTRDPEQELEVIKMRMQGSIDSEKAEQTMEADGTSGYQLGMMIEEFLRNVATGLENMSRTSTLKFGYQWNKSFSEGYGKVAGENNCHIYPSNQGVPVHVFLTTGLDNKKAMEKKESFMLEYYSENERMWPIKIF